MGGSIEGIFPGDNEAVDLGCIFKKKLRKSQHDNHTLPTSPTRKRRLGASPRQRRHSNHHQQLHAHHHVAKFLAIPKTDIATCSSIQWIQPGQGKQMLDRMPYQKENDKHIVSKDSKVLSLSLPILIHDTPESIGMKIPYRDWKNDKKKKAEPTQDANNPVKPLPPPMQPLSPSSTFKAVNSPHRPPTSNVPRPPPPSPVPAKVSTEKRSRPEPLSIRDLAKIVGETTRIQMIDVATQKETPTRYYFGGLVEYFEHNTHRHKYAISKTEKPKPPKRKAISMIDLVDTDGEDSDEADIVTKMKKGSHDTADKAAAKLVLPQPFHNQAREETRILNQRSYEFTGTPLDELVQSPQFVRDLDWIDHAWPSSMKDLSLKRHQWPAVQKYCLTSVAGAYTDFHVDFGGSAGWYHMVRGCKELVLIPPSNRTMERYETWLCLPNHGHVFFPDFVTCRVSVRDHSRSSPNTDPGIYRISLREGESLYLPPGWIHAVYTVEDSIAFGGNFMHGSGEAMKWQLKVDAMETRTRVIPKYRFPHFWPLQFYAAGMYLERMRNSREDDRDSSNRISQQELDGLPQFIDALEQWWKDHSKEEQAKLEDLQQEEQQKGKRQSVIDFHRRTTSSMSNPRPDLIGNVPNVASAVHYSLKHDGCISIENFFESLRTERDRVVEERKDDTLVSSSTPVIWALSPSSDPKPTQTANSLAVSRSPCIGKKPAPPPPPPRTTTGRVKSSSKIPPPPTSPKPSKRPQPPSSAKSRNEISFRSSPRPPSRKPPPPCGILPPMPSLQGSSLKRPPPPPGPPSNKPPPPPLPPPSMPRVNQEMD